MSLPGIGKTFDQFRADDASCRQFAFNKVGGVAVNQAATASAVGSVAIGTALVGSVFGTGAAQDSAYRVQRRFDYSYLQCMYASGDRVPVRGRMMVAPGTRPYSPPPPAS